MWVYKLLFHWVGDVNKLIINDALSIGNEVGFKVSGSGIVLNRATAIGGHMGFDISRTEPLPEQIIGKPGDWSKAELDQVLKIADYLSKLDESERKEYLSNMEIPNVISWTERGLNAISSLLTIASHPAILEILKRFQV